MAKGSSFTNSFIESTDPETGRTLVQLTGNDCVSHHPYFYNRMIDQAGRHLIYAGNRSGLRQLYRLDLNTGATLQLTDNPAGSFDDFSAVLSADDRQVYYARDNGIVRLDLASLEESTVYRSDAAFKFGSFGLSPDDRCILISEMDRKDVVTSKGDWSTFEPQWEAKPHCRLVYLDLATGRHHVVLDDPHCWLGHPQIRPGDNGQLLFCHEGPQWKIDARLWLVDADGTNLRCAKPRQAEDQIVTHEFWLADGSAIAYVHKTPDNVSTIRTIDPATLADRVLCNFTYSAQVFADPSGRWFVGVGQPESPVLPETGKDAVETMAHNKPYLFLIDTETGREEKLCRHGSSFKPYGNAQDCHPHPTFTPDSRAVLFSSDRNGQPAMYLVLV